MTKNAIKRMPLEQTLNIAHMGDAQKIVFAHSLLHETARLARQVNYPINSIILGATFYFARSAITECIKYFPDAARGVVNKLEFDKENQLLFTVSILCCIAAVMLVYRLMYQAWKMSSLLVLKRFPNGLFFDKTSRTLAAPQIQKRLYSTKEITALIQELHQLIIQQKRIRAMVVWASVTSSIILPVLFNLTSGIRLTLDADWFGVFLSVHGATASSAAAWPWIQKSLDILQRLPAYNLIYNYWSNYNTPKQLVHYQQQLEKLNDTNVRWQHLEDSGHAEKYSTVFMLDASNHHDAELTDKNGVSHKLSIKSYLTELYGVFLKNHVPVFLSEGNKMYLGYSDVNMVKLASTLQQNLLKATEHEKKIIDKIQELNNFMTAFEGKSVKWQSASLTSDNDAAGAYYYADISSLSVSEKVICKDVLSKIATKTELNGGILSIQGITDNIIKNDLKERIQNQNEQMRKVYDSVPPNQRSQAKHRNGPAFLASIPEETDFKKTIEDLPELIRFPSGATFVKSNTSTGDDKRAYPLHLSFIAGVRYFGSIDPRVFEIVSDHLNKESVLAPLNTGHVRTHATSSGIQLDKVGYTTVNDKLAVSMCKLKYPNNMRIWGRISEEVVVNNISYKHVRFDGPAYGH